MDIYNSSDSYDKECNFVFEVLDRYKHLSHKKIEFIKAFRADTGYGLKDSKDFVESYLGLSEYSVYTILDNAGTANSALRVRKQDTDKSKVFLIIQGVTVKYTAYSLDEARRVVSLLKDLGYYDASIFTQVE